MKEVELEPKFDAVNTGVSNDDDAAVESFENEGGITLKDIYENQLALVALLMRLYDVQMALLNATSATTADRIYEAHEKGGSFNPPLFIPDLGKE